MTEPAIADGDRVKVTMTGVYRQLSGPEQRPFVVINDGTTIDVDRWAVNIERLAEAEPALRNPSHNDDFPGPPWHHCPGLDTCPHAKRYTLAEARQELARQECAQNGHPWDVIETLNDGPIAVVCSRCGVSERVLP